MNELTKLILKWGEERNILKYGNATIQTLKLGEEYGELASGIAKEKPIEVKDALGDMYVVMVSIAALSGFTIQECVEHAYEQIKDRPGHLNKLGNFVKDED